MIPRAAWNVRRSCTDTGNGNWWGRYADTRHMYSGCDGQGAGGEEGGAARAREGRTNILTRVSDRVPRIWLSVLPGELSSPLDSAAAFASGSARYDSETLPRCRTSRMCRVWLLPSCQVTYALTIKGDCTQLVMTGISKWPAYDCRLVTRRASHSRYLGGRSILSPDNGWQNVPRLLRTLLLRSISRK